VSLDATPSQCMPPPLYSLTRLLVGHRHVHSAANQPTSWRSLIRCCWSQKLTSEYCYLARLTGKPDQPRFTIIRSHGRRSRGGGTGGQVPPEFGAMRSPQKSSQIYAYVRSGIVYRQQSMVLKGGEGTVEKFTPENMGTAARILPLNGTEPDIHLGVIYLILNFGVKETPKKLAWEPLNSLPSKIWV